MKGQIAFAALAGVAIAAPSTSNDAPTALSDNYAVRMYSNGTMSYGNYEAPPQSNIIADETCKYLKMPVGVAFNDCREYALKAAHQANTADDKVLNKWFGKSDPTSRSKIAGIYGEIAKECSTSDRGYMKMSCEYMKECTESGLIFIVVKGGGSLHASYCPLFFSYWDMKSKGETCARRNWPQHGPAIVAHAAAVPQVADLDFGNEQDWMRSGERFGKFAFDTVDTCQMNSDHVSESI